MIFVIEEVSCVRSFTLLVSELSKAVFCIILYESIVGAAIPPDHTSLSFHLSVDELSFIAFKLRLIGIFGVLESTLTVSDAVQVLSNVSVSIEVGLLSVPVLLSPVELPLVFSAISKSQSAVTLKEVVHPLPIVLSELI